MSYNQAAWLDAKEKPLRVGEVPMPTPGADEIVIKNHAVAMNPLDWHMQDFGVFIQSWPFVLGCDVAGEVYEVGSECLRFKKGDRVIGHAIGSITNKAQDGAFALYSCIKAVKAAILPSHISFTEGAVLPLAVETAVCGLYLKTPGSFSMMGMTIPTIAMGLPYPCLKPVPTGKTLIVYGGSSSVGSMAIQLAVASGLTVIAVAGAKNFDLCKQCGASEVFDYKDTSVVQHVIEAAKRFTDVVGIYDAISVPETYAHNLEILSAIGGGYLACTHLPPSENVPESVKAAMIFSIDDGAQPVWVDYVGQALENGQLKCLPEPTIVGQGLEYVQEGLTKLKAGVSATKLVVEL